MRGAQAIDAIVCLTANGSASTPGLMKNYVKEINEIVEPLSWINGNVPLMVTPGGTIAPINTVQIMMMYF